MTHDERRPVDAPRHGARGAHDALGFVLGAEVRVLEIAGLVEHVLAKDAVVSSRHGNRAHVVEAPGRDALGDLDRIAGPHDVHLVERSLARRHVVEAADVEEMRDTPAQIRELRASEAEARHDEVAHHRNDSLGTGVPTRELLFEAAERTRPHEDENLPRSPTKQLLDQMAADEAGAAGKEIVTGRRRRIAARDHPGP
ncbi:MAG TPA: hypothetical protein VMS22_25060 [Candidatus Eisenbacteria bacterium]|nr:hypothetical protein [Candidatus Eisenbacteria bacterium]